MIEIAGKSAEIRSIEKKIVPILRHNGVVKAGIFGSVARGKAKKRSDIDILVKFRGRKSLLDLVGLKLELEETLHRTVDVAEYSAIHPLLKSAILKEQVKIL